MPSVDLGRSISTRHYDIHEPHLFSSSALSDTRHRVPLLRGVHRCPPWVRFERRDATSTTEGLRPAAASLLTTVSLSPNFEHVQGASASRPRANFGRNRKLCQRRPHFPASDTACDAACSAPDPQVGVPVEGFGAWRGCRGCLDVDDGDGCCGCGGRRGNDHGVAPKGSSQEAQGCLADGWGG